MADNSSIEWTEATWNIVTGCTRVSAGCDHCYIERTPPFRMQHRKFDGEGVGATTGVKLHSERLHRPLRWRKPRRVFVNSLADLFHDEVPDRFIAETFAVMSLAPQHTFQLLTKRHARMRSLLNAGQFWIDVNAARLARGVSVLRGGGPVCLPNVWLGVSVEDQQWADIRIPALLETPAAVRWISAEPLLGAVDLTRWLYLTGGSTAGPWHDWRGQRRITDGRGRYLGGGGVGGQTITAVPSSDLHWIVCGGESGPGARPMELDWARTIVRQCQDAGVPAFVKQLGSRWGRDHHNIALFPEELRIREYPESLAAGGVR